ncbi:MAG TPA: hypothetical protein ENJ77_00990 [Candidatus Moranbacteria bacterium]|nr:hypothetical protein [Candidatus Moranbacteria bacterium]
MTVYSALRAGVWSMFLVVVLTLGGEIYAPIKDTLALFFGHHWVGKGVLAAVFWIVAAWIASDRPIENPERYLRKSLLLAAVAVFGFYLIHYFF